MTVGISERGLIPDRKARSIPLYGKTEAGNSTDWGRKKRMKDG